MKFRQVISKYNKMFIIAGIILAILLTVTLIRTFGQDTESSAWDGVIAKAFTSGTGTENNPYVISNPGELAYFKSLLEGEDASFYANKNYSITNNMDYSDYDLSINNTIPFAGTINGNYNFINNAKITNSLFASLDGATIKNLNLKELDVTVNTDTGVIANSINNTNIDFVLLDGDINLEEEIQNNINISGISGSANNSKLNGVIVNFNIGNNINFVSLINNGDDIEIK